MHETFLSLSKESFQIDLPPPTGTESYFIIAPHKAGSTLLFNIVSELGNAGGRSVVDLPGQAFRQGVHALDFPLETWSILDRPGYIFTGLRTPTILSSLRAYRTQRKIILVRDPRDIAVSYYFSIRDSHYIPTNGRVREILTELRSDALANDIEGFLAKRRADEIFENMRGFVEHIHNFTNFRIFRYEDVIFEKETFVAQLAATLQIDVAAETIREIAERHHIVPQEERPNEHIRQVQPGNFRRHLSANACRRLETVFGDVFAEFGYDLSCKAGSIKQAAAWLASLRG